jgi:hypothetical protein
MTRSILCGLLTLLSVGALAVVPIACQSGGVGDPCTPEDEYNTQFPGFKVQEENIESRSFQCSTRICLVNHFQGRVSCPLGQTLSDVAFCNPSDGAGACADSQATCKEADTFAPECTCDPTKTGDCANACGGTSGTVCDPKLKICTCTSSAKINGTDFYCALADSTCVGGTCAHVLKSYLCHKPGNCQSATGTSNAGKQCCVPGFDTPVGVPVCGQCDTSSHRNAADAVYCSCRCCPKCCDDPGLAMGEACEKDATLCGTACDPNFNYCKCPTGFSCSEIRKNVGLGDAQLTGSYCIKENSAYTGNSASCGSVHGNADPMNCAGTGTANLGDGG